MNDEDRTLIKDLIKSVSSLAAAIQHMPRSITTYPADYRPPGGYGASTCWGSGGGGNGH